MTIDVLEKPRARQDSKVGEDALLRGLFDRHGTALERYATKLLGGDRHAAADIVQETAVRAWQNVGDLDVGGEDFRPWLLKVARRLVIDRYRSRMRRPAEVGGDVPEWAIPVGDSPDRTLSTMVVADALASLSQGHREVINEVYFRGNSVAGTARLLGIPAGTVKSRTFNALRVLRAALAERGIMSPL